MSAALSSAASPVGRAIADNAHKDAEGYYYHTIRILQKVKAEAIIMLYMFGMNEKSNPPAMLGRIE